MAAISDERVCRVTYRSPNSAAERVLEVLPLKVFAHQGAAYLMVLSLKHASVGTLNLQRVRALEVTQERASAPPDFDAEQYENAAFGVHTGGPLARFVLRFESNLADYIRERTWHPSQTCRDLDDGRVELAFECSANWEVSAWVASWRRGVEVVEPPELRAELHELGVELARRYA